ncbi:carbon storage regulator [Planctomicrobium sp. SH661]|uniref:carbon storage regulator n=1 Tax=Planctomicrobium sp. SH661 TaxID=3448124 RepID=UPI003F5B55B9
MLVLTRKKQESIRIGNDIEVVVLEVAKNRVRLGFKCPAHISITREELNQMQKEIAIDLPVAESVDQTLVCA